jgi:uncharacterized membrane protein
MTTALPTTSTELRRRDHSHFLFIFFVFKVVFSAYSSDYFKVPVVGEEAKD